MFEHRLGLALGLTLGQIRALPNEEYRSWRSYYKLEPWGWQDSEYRTAALMATMVNTSATKRNQTKKISDFMRDPERAIASQINEAEQREKWLKATKKERMQMLAASFGGTGIKAKVKDGNDSD